MSKKNIAMEDLELEIKIQVEDPKRVIAWLDRNADFIKEINQEDHYFEHNSNPFIFEDKNNFKDANEWFRIRFTDKGNNICYKKCHNDENGSLLYSDEIETGIEDGNKIIKVLRILGFNETSIIKKNRRTYKYKEYQFDLDSIEDLGFFIEIEFQGEIEDLNKGREQINNFIRDIGIDKYKEVDTGYPQMFWNNKIIFTEDKF